MVASIASERGGKALVLQIMSEKGSSPFLFGNGFLSSRRGGRRPPAYIAPPNRAQDNGQAAPAHKPGAMAIKA